MVSRRLRVFVPIAFSVVALVPRLFGLYLLLFALDLLPRSLSHGNGPSDLDTGTLGPGLAITLIGATTLVVALSTVKTTWRQTRPTPSAAETKHLVR